VTCAACGRENREEARFCDSCGASLAQPEVRELRKVVTVLFCDVTGSTALGEKLDSESLRRVMERYFALARDVLERHGGTVEKFIGDAVMAVFGIPVVHEDDALRAARAAHELREGMAGLNGDLQRDYGTELQVRIGVNTGEVVTNDSGTLATGDAVNVAARLEQAAQPGDILIGDSTRQLAEGALELELVPPIEAKGKSQPLTAYRLMGVKADAPAFERRFDAPFVGRDGELEQLVHAYERAVRDRSCQLFTVLGPAGIGKSRLMYEFVEAHSDAIVLRGRCLAYGEGITYFPFVEILEQIAVDRDLGAILAEDEHARELLNTITASIGLTEEEVIAREDTFRAVRLLLETFARRQALVLVLEDLHWAEPTLLDLVDHIADWSREAPILLLCMARPELLDTRPGWGGGKLNASTILLEPLSEADADTLIDNLLLGIDLPDSLRARIVASAEGNPLFVEQMLALLAQDGGDGDREIRVPPTIQALLATRLEQLPSTERVAAERASVIGKEFWRTALVEIGGEVDALPGLVRRELIRPYRSPVFPADDAFRFRHQLIRDAAYDGMPKELRADLHERFGNWLETNRSEYDEIVGYHFEQAFRLREQLGPVDDSGRALAAHAGKVLGAAGHRAFERGDTPAAIGLLARATELLPPGDRHRLELGVELGYAFQEGGQLEQARSIFSGTMAAAAELEERALEARGRIGLIFVDNTLGSSVGSPRQAVEAEVAKLEALQDDSGLAEAYSTLAAFQSWEGDSEGGGAAARRAFEHGRRAGSVRIALRSVAFRIMLQAWGCTPAREGREECDRLLTEYAGTSIEPAMRYARALHLSFLGEADDARRDQAVAAELFEQFGDRLHMAAANMNTASTEIRAGRCEIALSKAQEGVEGLEPLGEQGFLSSMLGFLTEALYRLGRYDEAERAARRTAALAMPDDFEPNVRWRSVLAKVQARRGRFDDAEPLAREAVEIADATDWHIACGDAWASLGEVLALAGRSDEARTAYEHALERFERKGSLPDQESVRRRLTELQR